MAELINLVPDEWRSAFGAYRSIFSVLDRTAHGRAHVALSNGIPIILGIGIDRLVRMPLEAEFVKGIATGSGLLAGFVITQLLVIGTAPDRGGLMRDQMRRQQDKVKYLIASEVFTLAACIVTLCLSTWWLFYDPKAKDVSMMQHMLGVLVMGATAWTLVRAVLLPAQIIEMHLYNMSAALAAKDAELEAERRSQREQLDRLQPWR